MKKILAVEASTKACSVALVGQGDVIERFELTPQKHAERMLPMVDQVLAQAHLTGLALDALAYAEGPGAFTGVRVATGVVQGLALGWQRPVIGVSTLEALAWPILQEQPLGTVCLACLDARMQEIYVQRCWRDQQGHLQANPPELLRLEDLKVRIVTEEIALGVGDIEADYPQISNLFTQWVVALPHASAIAQLASQRFEQAKTLDEHLPMPLYLRNNVADKPKAVP